MSLVYDEEGSRDFSRYDLENGIEYCLQLRDEYGFTTEPLDGFDLTGYIEWAKRTIEQGFNSFPITPKLP